MSDYNDDQRRSIAKQKALFDRLAVEIKKRQDAKARRFAKRQARADRKRRV